jgi:hypothetical protein
MAPANCFVQPPGGLAPEILALSPADQFIIRNFVSTLLCFKLDVNCPINEIIEDLKEGLSNTIAEIPFLAGILRKESEERWDLHVDIAENAGVELRINDMRHLSGGMLYDFDALVAAGIPPSELDFDKLVAGTLIPPPEPVCLAVQANFVKGGLLLNTHLHHAVMDGSGLFTFLTCLAKHTAAASRSKVVQLSDLLSEDCLDRNLLQANPSRRQMTEYPGFRPAQAESWAPKADSALLMEKLVIQARTDKLKKVEKSWWVMSPEQIRGLEEEILSANPGATKPTLNSTLSAFLWRHMSLARLAIGEDIKKSGLLTVVDIRSRIEPPLPSDYVGNALIFARADTDVSKLCSKTPRDLYETASKITESVNWWDADKIEALLGAVEGTSDMRSIEWNVDCHFGNDVQVTSTLGAASPYELDWGSRLGKFKALRFPTGAFYDGFVTVLPRLPDGSVEFVLNAGVAVLKVLQDDVEFNKYATFSCF